MLLYLTLICVIMLCIVSCFAAAATKKGSLVFLLFGYLFLALVVALSISLGKQGAPTLFAEVRTSLLTWYIPEGANTSEEKVYIAVTESGSYRFCYFEDDGISIKRAQLKADEVDIQSSEEAARVDWYYYGDVLTKVVVYIPDDANAIMFEPEDHSLSEDNGVNPDGT